MVCLPLQMSSPSLLPRPCVLGGRPASTGSLPWLPVSWVQPMGGTNMRLEHRQWLCLALVTQSSSQVPVSAVPCPLPWAQGCYHWPRRGNSFVALRAQGYYTIPAHRHPLLCGTSLQLFPKGTLIQKPSLSNSRRGHKFLKKRVFQSVAFVAIWSHAVILPLSAYKDGFFFLKYILWVGQNYVKMKVRTEMPTKISVQGTK